MSSRRAGVGSLPTSRTSAARLMRIGGAWAALLAFAWVGAAGAVVIDSGDGAGNTSPPTDDPGLANVGTIGTHAGVYLGNGWVLTANHIASADLVIAGQTFKEVAGSKLRLTTPGVGLADLKLLKFDGAPALPAVNIATARPPNGNAVLVMYGRGRNRGAATSWQDTDGQTHDGYLVTTSGTLRWGNNKFEGAFPSPVLDTEAYLTLFDQSGGTSDECQAAQGDSGGGVFYKRFGSWELSGIMFATYPYPDQPANMVLYGNGTVVADLSVYRAEILGVINTPTCSDGLDDDGDGLTDFPADPGCSAADDDDERDAALVCDNGIDEDGDGLVDWPADPGCDDSLDPSEHSSALLCDDGLDNEGDGLTDFPEDPECTSPTSPNEGPAPYVPVTSGLGSGLLMAAVGAFGGRRAQP